MVRTKAPNWPLLFDIPRNNLPSTGIIQFLFFLLYCSESISCELVQRKRALPFTNNALSFDLVCSFLTFKSS